METSKLSMGDLLVQIATVQQQHTQQIQELLTLMQRQVAASESLAESLKQAQK